MKNTHGQLVSSAPALDQANNQPTTGGLTGWLNRILGETSSERAITLILGTTFAFWGWMAINVVELREITAQMDVRLTVVENQLVELKEDTYNRFEKIEARIDALEVRLTALEKKVDRLIIEVEIIKRDIAEIKNALTEIDARFDRIDKKFDKIDEKFVQIDEKFVQIDERFDKIDERFDQIDEKFDQIDEKFVQIDEKFVQIDQQLVALTNNFNEQFVQIHRRIDTLIELLMKQAKPLPPDLLDVD